LPPGSSSVYDFRLVRTARISGHVWLDTNENGTFDENEKPLADIRVVTASLHLLPGEHIFLIDEKTLPAKTWRASSRLLFRHLPDARLAA